MDCSCNGRKMDEGQACCPRAEVCQCPGLTTTRIHSLGQLMSSNGSRDTFPAFSVACSRHGFCLSIQGSNWLFVRQVFLSVLHLTLLPYSYIENFLVYKKYGSTCLVSATFWDATPTYWFADADAVKAIMSDRFTFTKDVEAVGSLSIMIRNTFLTKATCSYFIL